ncbi:protein of unknown function [Methylocaldum szegediense]|uniref:Uncharacterized protein n=1 Tax=Methylocaldum szegediense TaxID=73780 RepID=A0ABN8X1H7_9GAMM|nr:protein of unknown function [Methylocaldum szegediense]
MIASLIYGLPTKWFSSLVDVFRAYLSSRRFKRTGEGPVLSFAEGRVLSSVEGPALSHVEGCFASLATSSDR